MRSQLLANGVSLERHVDSGHAATMDALLNACTTAISLPSLRRSRRTPAHSQRDSDGASALICGGPPRCTRLPARRRAVEVDRCDSAGNYALDASSRVGSGAELLLAVGPRRRPRPHGAGPEGDKLLDTAVMMGGAARWGARRAQRHKATCNVGFGMDRRRCDRRARAAPYDHRGAPGCSHARGATASAPACACEGARRPAAEADRQGCSGRGS